MLAPSLMLAQNEFLNQSNTISGGSLNLPNKPNTPKPMAPSIFAPNSNVLPSSKIPEKNTLQFTNTNKFVNPGDIYKDKNVVKEAGFDSKIFRKNQYFGDFKTKADHVRISYRDFGEIDGDEIKILVNDKMIVARIFLEGDFNGIELGLEKGFNKIDFEALNQGTSGPNTAQFQIYDDKGMLVSSNQWNLATGFKATIIIVKE